MLGEPLAASVRMGSALGLVAATAMGPAPTSRIPTAPTASSERSRYEGVRRSSQPAGAAAPPEAAPSTAGSSTAAPPTAAPADGVSDTPAGTAPPAPARTGRRAVAT